MYKEIFRWVIAIISQPAKAWALLAKKGEKQEEFLSRFVYPLIGFVTVAAFLGVLFTRKEFDVELALKSSMTFWYWLRSVSPKRVQISTSIVPSGSGPQSAVGSFSLPHATRLSAMTRARTSARIFFISVSPCSFFLFLFIKHRRVLYTPGERITGEYSFFISP